ncbi:MAG TPA: hypothetical protein VFQ65_28515 [Kofleriaceae bacterium]|nr:hypothetical protein [Kofleriaceae bacterium]
MAQKPPEDPMVAKAFGAGSEQDLAELIGKLDPAEADYFLKKLEAALRKRKIMLSGYIVAMVAWVVGMVCALAYFGMASGFTGWVFLVPFLIVGVILWIFGNLAERAGRAVPDPKT